ncbi:hypothetical protein V1639_08915 [Pseudarthrobacter sp. J75]|uniref:hypothetical protein n=1 Tax=Pseudarthrobacter sp. J75 TaxID=3116486 RepID=UPI002E80E051|nr:hypothetical protein [Pseudarthrobacter sp. J75]MEE2529149.1 hypothetical protein [Pseudarthrobacter sp. J75]
MAFINSSDVSQFTTRVRTVTDNGGTTTSDFQAILDRWTTFRELHSQAAINLAKAVTTGTTEDLATLRALAIAEATATTVTEATVSNVVAGQVFEALRTEYAPVAAANYERIRKAFNETAGRFIKAVEIVHPDAAPEQLMSATAPIRSAWADAPMLALELDAQAVVLAEAANLAGYRTGQKQHSIGLTVNTDGLHRRRVYEAWDTSTGRTRRWGALLDLGATIEAPALDEYEAYREPADILIKQERHGIGWVNVEIDPEDTEYELDTHSALEVERHANRPEVTVADGEAERLIGTFPHTIEDTKA